MDGARLVDRVLHWLSGIVLLFVHYNTVVAVQLYHGSGDGRLLVEVVWRIAQHYQKDP